jgi:hypothetical protein
MPVHIMAKPVQTAAVTVDAWFSAAETIAAPVRGIFSLNDDHVSRFRRMNGSQTDHVSHATVMNAVPAQGWRRKDAHRYYGQLRTSSMTTPSEAFCHNDGTALCHHS